MPWFWPFRRRQASAQSQPTRPLEFIIEAVVQPHSIKHYTIKCLICSDTFRVSLILDDDLYRLHVRCPKCGNNAMLTAIQASMRRRMLLEREAQKTVEEERAKLSNLSVGRVIDIDNERK
jgi:DNA-directed RNA polymerase subunit RPC12/RpoP